MPNRICILLADDERPLLHSLRLALEDANPNWNIVAVSCVEDALSTLQNECIDLILTDNIFEDNFSGGLEILRAGKAIDSSPEVIIFTAGEEQLERNKAFELGVYDCIRKKHPGHPVARGAYDQGPKSACLSAMGTQWSPHRRRL